MKILTIKTRQAFAMVEALVVTLALIGLVVLAIVGIGKFRQRANDLHCVNHLEIIGISLKSWQDEHGGSYPMDISVAQGGSRELLANGNVGACFQVMSNELSLPIILTCLNDAGSQAAQNWGGRLTRTNLSYFLGLAATNAGESVVLAGDDNLLQNSQPVSPGIINLSTTPATWTGDRHHGAGNILLVDCSVQTVTQIGFVSPPGTWFATNRIVIP